MSEVIKVSDGEFTEENIFLGEENIFNSNS